MDVVFDEDKSWDWDKKFEETILCDLDWGDKDVEAVVEENIEEHEVRYNTEIICLPFVPSNQQTTGILTKSLTRPIFEH